MNVYLYKEYNDNDAYGEELTAVYEDREDALAHLAERFKTCTGMTMQEYNAKHPKDDSSTVEPDYVCYDTGDGYWFGVVEEKTFGVVEEKTVTPPHGQRYARKYLEKVNKITGSDFYIFCEDYGNVCVLTLYGRRIKTFHTVETALEEFKKVQEKGLPLTEESCIYLKVKDLVKDYISGKLVPEEV
jgi:hypothetical protein